ncbi:hypothetical protein ACFVW8_15700 [Streptomyces sp. NPDC058221]|uniref:hypothetical protein n=1 Tax=Streptomyces sp. NPDC058221 TaxID=3346388 RepID=UPI0036E04D39
MNIVKLDGKTQLLAYVFPDDSNVTRKAWVCVGVGDGHGAPQWVGFWSSGSQIPSKVAVEKFLRALAPRVVEGVSVGVMGPFLDDYLFFDGWDTWGPGVPAELANFSPRPPEGGAEVSSITDLRLQWPE